MSESPNPTPKQNKLANFGCGLVFFTVFFGVFALPLAWLEGWSFYFGAVSLAAVIGAWKVRGGFA